MYWQLLSFGILARVSDAMLVCCSVGDWLRCCFRFGCLVGDYVAVLRLLLIVDLLCTVIWVGWLCGLVFLCSWLLPLVVD